MWQIMGFAQEIEHFKANVVNEPNEKKMCLWQVKLKCSSSKDHFFVVLHEPDLMLQVAIIYLFCLANEHCEGYGVQFIQTDVCCCSVMRIWEYSVNLNHVAVSEIDMLQLLLPNIELGYILFFVASNMNCEIEYGEILRNAFRIRENVFMKLG